MATIEDLEKSKPDHASSAVGPRFRREKYIHPTVIFEGPCTVGRDVIIGEGTVIGSEVILGHGTVIGADCKIGDKVELAPHVFIGDKVKLDNKVKVGMFSSIAGNAHVDNRTVIGSFFVVEDGDPVTIGIDCVIGTHCVMAAGLTIGALCVVANQCYVAESLPDGTIYPLVE